jgi:photosystem II stability/assembly factor-like uncharacterized protein
MKIFLSNRSGFLKKGIKSILCFLFFILCLEDIRTQPQWQITNGPYGGNIKRIEITKDKKLFLLTDKIYSTDNKQKTWSLPFRINLNNMNDYGNPETFTVGDSAIYIGSSKNIYRSKDNGKTWLRIMDNGTTTLHPSQICLGNRGRIIIGAQLESYKSDDDGNSWKKIKGKSGSIDIEAIIKDSKGNFYAGGYNGLYYSSNGMDSVSFLFQDYVVALGIDSKDNIYASINWGGGSYVMKKSTDAGKTWSFIYSGLNPGLVKSIAVDSLDNVYAGTDSGGVYISTNGGLKWTQTSLKNIKINTLITGNNGEIYAGTESRGVCYSSDYGNTWLLMNEGLYSSEWGPMALGVNSEGRVFAGYMIAGAFRTTNGGKSWEQKNNGIQLPNVSCFFFQPGGYTFAGTLNGLYRSSDNGDTWEMITKGINQEMQICNIIQGKNGDLWLSSESYNTSPGNNGVLRSTDNGTSWSFCGLEDMICSVTINKKGYIFASNSMFGNGSCYRSIDNGATWKKLTLKATAIRLAVNSKDYIYANTAELPSGPGVYVSTDDGLSWGKIFTKGPLVTTNDMYITRNDDVYICTSNGLYKSNEDFYKWELQNPEIKDTIFVKVVVDPNGIMYGMTPWGVYKTTNTVLKFPVWKNNYPGTFQLNQNYPNPFNPSTIIEYENPRTQHISLCVYDINGKLIENLEDNIKPPGIYKCKFERDDISSGIYFYRLKSDSYTETKKMLLIR